ncbi:hypothetical protein OG218_01550 [Kineococcus sp. NBC_00420]|uniref:hypothetical protein n=1 Tax=Kineococcus sp. NBC_00420 TaxID=2903564 RepID=UPI002E22F577
MTNAIAAVVIWHLLLPTGAIISPLWTQAVGWPLAFLLRSEPVQRLLGGGRLDNRVWLRVFLGCSACTLAVAPTGMSFLVPIFAAVTACAHLQWSGSRAWRPSMVIITVATATVQGLIVLGWQRTPCR